MNSGQIGGQTRHEAIHGLLWASGAQRSPAGPSSTLYEHLLNTGAILRHWRQPDDVVSAGTLCRIYSTDFSPRALVPLSRREAIQEVAGTAVERLAWLFCSISWLHLFEELDGLEYVIPVHGIIVNCREPDHEHKVALTKEEALSLLVIHIASEAECSRGEHGEPGVWLSRVSRVGSHIRRNGGLFPAVFDSCSSIVLPEIEFQAREDYLSGLDAIPVSFDAAENLFSTASANCPWIAEPLIWRAFIAIWRMNFDLAESLLEQASAVLYQWGTPWDKRLVFTEWLWLLSVLQRWIDGRAGAGTLPTPSTADPRDFVKLIRHGAADPGHRATIFEAEPEEPRSPETHAGPPPAGAERSRLDQYLHSFQSNHRAPQMRTYPGLPSRAWHDPDRFEITQVLKQNFEEIRKEALAIRSEAFHSETEGILRSGDWDVFLLYEGGWKNESNCALCPLTTQLVEQHGVVKTMAGTAYFSRMSAGAHIAPHRGPTNLRVRCHLALEVPAGDCQLRVGVEKRRWKSGECMVFDDSLEHEAWNRTDSPRVVLIVDLWHPNLSKTEIAVLEGMHRYAYAAARDLNQYWSANTAARRTTHV